MADQTAEGERYALLRWFVQNQPVDPRAVCYRCANLNQFRAVRVVERDDSTVRTIARAGDDVEFDGLSTEIGDETDSATVQVHDIDGDPLVSVPLVAAPGRYLLVLAPSWDGGVDPRDHTFFHELGQAVGNSVVPDEDSSRSTGPQERQDRDNGEMNDLDTARNAPGDRPRKLQALQTTAQDLVRARTKSEIAQVTTETARDVLDCPVTGMWLYDPQDDTLKPAAVTDDGRELLGDPVSFDRGESLAWEAFETGEIGQYDDVRTVDGAFNPTTPIRSEIDVPVGRHGVLTSATTRLAEFTDTDIDLLRILAANAEAVLDRTDREREIERYQEMVEVANDPIWAVDGNGRLTHLNKSFVELTGRSRQSLLDSPVADIFAPDVVERATEEVRALRASDSHSTTYEETVAVADDRPREFRIGLSLLFEDGEFTGTVFVGHDVTELRRNEQRLSVFNRVLRHNIRNQLTVILAHVAELASASDSRVAARAKRAQAAARNLHALAEKAQRFRRITDAAESEVGPIDVTALVDGAVEAVRDDNPDARISVSHPEAAWAEGHGTLEYAIEELLENAIRHSEADPEIEVAVTVSEAQKTVDVTVADNGPGIPRMERQVLESGLETPLEHASGLGLWMVRWATITAGGSLEIRDNEPQGTVFVLHLPRSTTPDLVA